MALITVGAGRCWQYSHTLGRRQTAGTGFSRPVAVGLGNDGVLFVANRGAPRISKVTVDEEFLTEFGRGGQDEGQFVYLTAVAVDQDENVYTADEWLHRITVFDQDGTLLQTWGEPGEGEGQLNGPAGLAFDAAGNLVVVNSLNSRIQKFTREGQYLGGFGTKGSGEAELDLPWGIAIDNQDNIYVADWNNHRVQKFSPEGDHLLTFGSGEPTGVARDGSTPYAHATVANIGVKPSDLNHPTDVAVDADGDVYVVDWMNERVVIFDYSANPVATLRGDSHELSPWAQMTLAANPDLETARRRVKNPEIQNYFRMPVGCTYDQANDRLIVADTQHCRLQVYVKDRNYLEPQLNL
ncbi:MAG: NHL repeat-containing protein [Dehalococcoidia bacterium]